MSKLNPSSVGPGHPDYDVLIVIADAIAIATRKRPQEAFSLLTLEAIEFVLDPVRTGRTTLSELDNVEKTFIGLKIEHFLRDMLDAPKGVRDLVIAGHDVDVKNTVSTPWAWMIPPETFRNEEPVVLIAANETERKAWMGLMVTRDGYLGKPNRDGKRGILTPAYANILWVAPAIDWPPNRWREIDMARFRELRNIRGGSRRAATFFAENQRKIIHRKVVQALLHDQDDPMKRLRGNHGARDLLAPTGVALLSGTRDGPLLRTFGYELTGQEFMAVSAQTADEAERLRLAKKIT
jgi:hypothetical protein